MQSITLSAGREGVDRDLDVDALVDAFYAQLRERIGTLDPADRVSLVMVEVPEALRTRFMEIVDPGGDWLEVEFMH